MTRTIQKPAFKIIGIAVMTSNQNRQAATDIGALWQQFFQKDILNKIPQKINSEIYMVYTDYEGDYMAPYRAILGCLVEASATAPVGMIEKLIPAQIYQVYTAKGKMPVAVGQTWQAIWNDSKLKRAYQADFDVYGPKSQDPTCPEVEIFVGV